MADDACVCLVRYIKIVTVKEVPLVCVWRHIAERVCVHPESPQSGEFWTSRDVIFNKLKLTNSKTCCESSTVSGRGVAARFVLPPPVLQYAWWTPFTRYNRLLNRLNNRLFNRWVVWQPRLNNRLHRVNEHSTGCQTGWTAGWMFGWHDAVRCSTGCSTGLTTGCIV